MKPNEVIKIFEETGAFLKGHFLLSSGLHSAEYLQCALVLQYPEYSEKLSKELAKKFNKDGITVVIGPALGAVTLSYEMARPLRARSLFAERQDGKMMLRRGFKILPSDKVLVVEDVITTGGSTKEVIDLVKAYGAELIGVAAIVDRSQEKIDFGARCKTLVKLDIKTYRPEECPLCKKGLAVVKPGTRK